MVDASSFWSDHIAVRVSAHDMWNLMWRQQQAALWLGPQARVDLKKGARWLLADEGGHWRSATVVKIVPAVRVTVAVESRGLWRINRDTIVCIRIVEDVSAIRVGCVITIEESDIPPGRRAEVERFWSGCLERLCELAGAVYARRQSVRQAVVVFHGIGEQQPGQTLRALADSGVLGPVEGTLRSWVKPDHYAGLYDVRRLTVEASDTRPTTDVFECYWAHLIRDTTLDQLGAWFQRLLLRRQVPPPLRVWWALSWVLAVGGLTAALWSMTGGNAAKWIAAAPWLGVAAVLLWRWVGRSFALNYIGDAARYLRPHPANIAHRQAIREAGVSLVEKLHRSGRYDRVVLLGHSLGSVIAYDIVTHAWLRMNAAHRSPPRPSFKEAIAIERTPSTPAEDVKVQDRQHAAWCRQRANTQPWLVTDLITLGSPLTYADFLLADDGPAFDRAKAERVLPTAPPVTELEVHSNHARMTYDLHYREPISGAAQTFVVFHHGAPFAVTRWTNLYFTARLGGLSGDIIGGPVGPQLGAWVKDVALDSKGFGSTHTMYWRALPKSTAHLEALRDALHLEVREELLQLVREQPAAALLAEAEHRRRD